VGVLETTYLLLHTPSLHSESLLISYSPPSTGRCPVWRYNTSTDCWEGGQSRLELPITLFSSLFDDIWTNGVCGSLQRKRVLRTTANLHVFSPICLSTADSITQSKAKSIKSGRSQCSDEVRHCCKVTTGQCKPNQLRTILLQHKNSNKTAAAAAATTTTTRLIDTQRSERNAGHV